MEKTIYWRDALKQLGEDLSNYTINFNNETVNWRDAMKFGKHQIKVPLELIDNEEAEIDDSDIDLTGGYKVVETMLVTIRKDNLAFIKKQDKDISEYINELIEKARR